MRLFFRTHRVDEHVRKQIYDIGFNPKLPGRTVFCKNHILEHTEHTKEERKVFRLAPSLKTKIENVMAVIENEVWSGFKFNRVVMESNNFDIAAKTQGKKRLLSEEYGKGPGKDKKSSLIAETGGRCIYCGGKVTKDTMQEDHIFPVKAGGSNIYANLIACCGKCNPVKDGRTPQESGKKPQPEVIDHMTKELNRLKVKLWKLRPRWVKVGDKFIRKARSLTPEDIRDKGSRNTLELKLKILEDARNINKLDFNKYMSHAAIGWRHMRDRLREITGDDKLPIERQSGIVTAFFRKGWDYKKDREGSGHHALDAIILASRKGCNAEGWADMRLKPKHTNGSDFDPEKHLPEKLTEFKRDKSSRGAALHDAEPLSLKGGVITQRVCVTKIKRGKNRAVSDEWRKMLEDAFDRFNIKEGQSLDDNQAVEAGFLRRNTGRMMSLKCAEAGIGRDQIVKIKNNHFKSNAHNSGVAVYLDGKGKKKAAMLKNPRLTSHFIEPQKAIDGKILYTLKKNDRVIPEGENKIYQILELGVRPVIEIQFVTDANGKKKRKKLQVPATKLKKI